MRRGEIWTVAGGADYAGKPRPAVVVQDDHFDATLFDHDLCVHDGSHGGAAISDSGRAHGGNGLHARSRVMVDKITTVAKAKLGMRIGRLSDEDTVRLNRAIVVFLGLAGSPRSKR
jgi:mRNA interferase MazF